MCPVTLEATSSPAGSGSPSFAVTCPTMAASTTVAGATSTLNRSVFRRYRPGRITSICGPRCPFCARKASPSWKELWPGVFVASRRPGWIGTPSRALTTPTMFAGTMSAGSTRILKRYVLMRYWPGGSTSTCGPFWPPARRNASPSWKVSCVPIRLAKMRPGARGLPSIDSTMPTSFSPMTIIGRFWTRYRYGNMKWSPGRRTRAWMPTWPGIAITRPSGSPAPK